MVVELPNVARWRRSSFTVVERMRRDGDRSVVAMVALCVAAAAVRVATSRGLWVDEAISVSQAQLPFGEMLADVRNTDVHPPLHHALLWVTVRLFGTSEFAVRLPSLIAGVALVPVVGWVGRLLYDRRTGWVAAVLAAIAPFGVWYSQEARMYSLFMLFAALAIGLQVQALRRGRTRRLGAVRGGDRSDAVDPVLRRAAGARPAVGVRPSCCGAGATTPSGAACSCVAGSSASPWSRWRCCRCCRSCATSSPPTADRGVGLTPGQAGAGSSTLGGTISIYAVGANLIWAMLGYHADGVMVQLAALWPLLMLLALVMLGRGRSARSVLPARPRRRADDGAVRRRLAEARPVRAALLLRRRAGDCCCSLLASSR